MSRPPKLSVLKVWPVVVLFSLLTGLPVSSAEQAAQAEVMLDFGYPAKLQKRLMAALAAKGPDYRPRTRHLLSSGAPQYTNRLILEDSPYLQQHAHNPVDWHPWGEEAFEKAKRENKPIFLSIGYSTCHWCHVMEEESFDNPRIAKLLNKYFVPIKVDRERRPDVDKSYMTAVMLLTGRGGWPMSSFLTPEGKTFHGGTYFPPQQFGQLLSQVNLAWQQRQSELRGQADRIASAVAKINAGGGKARKLGDFVIDQAIENILKSHDDFNGGFGEAPKFPREPSLFLLLGAVERNNDREALAAIESSLKAMAQGGIYDQIGGGFHRYATDDAWLIPHFEKMLYNQAHLARAYLLAWRLTGHPLYERVVRQTLDYVLREMTSLEGGFYSATDADSEGEEGRFFVWTPDELRQALTPKDAELALDLFYVTPRGNFEGRNILHLPVALDAYADMHNRPPPALFAQLDAIREQLRLMREKRIHPLRDNKILTSWNGMMISTFALAGDYLNDSRYLEAAKRAAEFVWSTSRQGEGDLLRVHLNGSSSVPAGQDDYAYFAEGLIHLYDATGDRKWLLRGQEMADAMLARFWDEQGGGFFMSMEGGLSAMGRPKDSTDNAIPSGNSVALQVLSKLLRRNGALEYRVKANATLAAFAAEIDRGPSGYAYMLRAADDLLHGELGGRQYAANGAVPVHLWVDSDEDGRDWLMVDIAVAPNWHINSHRPLQGDLIATELALSEDAVGWQLGEVEYPTAELKRLRFKSEPLALYEGRVSLRAELKRVNKEAEPSLVIPVQLGLQACNDRICLAPEILKLQVPEAALSSNPAGRKGG